MKKFLMKFRYNTIIICISLTLICFISIGYSALNHSLHIKGNVVFEVSEEIKITNISSNHVETCGYDVFNPRFTTSTITINANLPNIDCKLEYEITISNQENTAMQLISINDDIYNNFDIVYELNGIELNTILSADTTTTFTITFSYASILEKLPEKTDISAILLFVWKPADEESPIITINDKDYYTIFSGEEVHLESLVTIIDNVDIDIKDKLIISSNFDNCYGGLYTIKYNAEDNAGNKAGEVIITIYVIEFIKIAPGRYHTLALTRDGFVYSWGHNDLRQLGDGTTTNRLNPIKINNFSNIIDIAAGYGSSYVVTNEGKVYSWGYGIYGQLGHGSSSSYSVPTVIAGLENEKITNIAASYHSVIALTENGNVYTWGYNDYRQVGNGGTSTRNTPYLIPTLFNIKYISSGYWHTIAANDTEVYVWGSNLEGQLGIPGLTNSATPTRLPFDQEIKQISAGGRHTFILTKEGEVYVTGYNIYGQAGLGNTSTVTSPKLISTLSDIKEIDAGYQQSIALTNKGEVYVWGYNYYAMLGLGNTTSQNRPVLNNNLENIRHVTTQYETTFYLNNTGGKIYGSGYNLYGCLGNGTNSNSSASIHKGYPTKVSFILY